MDRSMKVVRLHNNFTAGRWLSRSSPVYDIFALRVPLFDIDIMKTAVS